MQEFIMKTFLSVLMLFASFVVYQPVAKASETDTHFYDIYTMARMAGLNHEHALFCATASQWIDVGMTSSPMFFIAQRRGYHFNDYRSKSQKVTQDGHSTFSPITITEMDHPVAYKMFDEGLQQRNLMKMCHSLHMIVDTAGHAGFTAEGGHAFRGHDPDRTWQAVAKYKEMVGMVFKALLAIRELAPDEALDPAAIEARKTPLQNDDYKKLENAYWEKMHDLIARNYFKDPSFTPDVVNYMLRMAVVKGYIQKIINIDQHLPRPEDYLLNEQEQAVAKAEKTVKFKDGTPDYLDQWDATRKDARTVLKEWVAKHRNMELQRGVLVTGSVFKMEMLDYYGHGDVREHLIEIEKRTTDTKERIAAYKAIVTPEMEVAMIEKVVNHVTRGHIPQDFSDRVHVQFENDEGARSREVKLKELERRIRIAEMFGVNIKFKANTFGERRAERAQEKKERKIQEQDFDLDLTLEEPAEPAILKQYPLELASFTLTQQGTSIMIKLGRLAKMYAIDIADALTRGQFHLEQYFHRGVKGFQMPVILRQKIENKVYKKWGPLSTMGWTGRTKPTCKQALSTEEQ